MKHFLKGIYADSPVRLKLGILLFLIISGTILSSSILLLIKTLTGNNTLFDSVFYSTHFAQVLAGIFVLILPSTGTAYLCGKNSKSFLYIRKVGDSRPLILSGLMIIFILPVIRITSFYNQQITLPEFMAPVETWMKQMEDSAMEVTNILLSQKGILPLSVNILVIAVFAGISEELLFRSTFFSILKRRITNPHLIVWLTAVIFSIIHLQFYGFIPRLLLGALLGYLLIWTNNIWIPAFAHFLNNTITIIYGYFTDNDASLYNDKATEPVQSNPYGYLLTATIGLMLFFGCVYLMMNHYSNKKSTYF
jgi:membrane protease YdiL (CAAX protease family)